MAKPKPKSKPTAKTRHSTWSVLSNGQETQHIGSATILANGALVIETKPGELLKAFADGSWTTLTRLDDDPGH